MGGARAHSGPTADPSSKTQMRKMGDWSILPHAYTGAVPEWPLNRDHRVTVGAKEDAYELSVHDGEIEHWERLWNKGQGAMWRRNHQEDRVARLCRLLAISDVQLDVTRSGWLSEIRQLEEDLGLSQSGMLRNKWRYSELEDEQPAEPEEKDDSPAPRRQSAARSRMAGLKVVE